MILTAAKVYAVGINSGVKPQVIFLSDATFELPSERWITGKFSLWFDKLLSRLGLQYATDTWDCENFTQLARAFANVSHRRTRGDKPGHGLGMGEFWYLPKGSLSLHSIISAITVQHPDRLTFFEPQPNRGSMKKIDLSRNEIMSCANWQV